MTTSRIKYQDTVVDSNGDVIGGAAVEVRNVLGGGLASVYNAETGGTPATNPFSADADGNFTFWAAPGQYDITVGTDPNDSTKRASLSSAKVNYGSRPALVTDVGNGATWPDGTILSDGVVLYEYSSGASDIPDLAGVKPLGDLKPDHYGIAVDDALKNESWTWDASLDKTLADGFAIVDPSIRLYDQGFGSGSGCLVRDIPRSDHFTIDSAKGILDPDKKPFIVKGVSIFDYLLVSFESRTTYDIRPSVPAGTAGTSKATGFSRIQWRSYSYMSELLDKAVQDGVNFIRVGVDPANENTAAQDAADSIEYPGDMYMLGSIIYEATKRGIVVLLRQGRKDATATQFAAFMVRLMKRHKNNPYVWYTPENEINGGITNDVGVWTTDTETYLTAMRGESDKAPICIHTTNFSGQTGLDNCYTAMTGSSTIADDPAVMVAFHIYQKATELDGFLGETRQNNVETSLQKAYRAFCIFVDEVGIDNNLSGGRDRELDGDTGDHALWDTGAQAEWSRELGRFFVREVRAGRLSGICATTYSAYIPGTDRHDANSLRVIGKDGDSGDLVTWGRIYFDYLNKDMSRIPRPDGNRLTFESGTGLVLKPVQHNSVVIGDNEVPIPNGGISLGSSGLTDDTLFYIYASKASSGNYVLSASTTAPVRDPATGNWVKAVATSVTGGSGNTFEAPEDTFVGLAYKKAGVGFVDSATQRFVRSQWNRAPYRVEAALSSDDAKAAVIEDIDSLQLEFVLFADEYAAIQAASKFSVSGGLTSVTFRIQEGGTTINPDVVYSAPAGESLFLNTTALIGGASDSYYDVRANGGAGGNTVTFKAGARLQGIIN